MTAGAWNRSKATKTYTHSTGTKVQYRNNTCDWEIIGGAADGHRYGTLKVAAHVVESGRRA